VPSKELDCPVNSDGPPNADQKPDGKLVKAETRSQGGVGRRVYGKFISAMGSYSPVYAVTVITAYVLVPVTDWWLTKWIENDQSSNPEEGKYMGTYAGLVLTHCILLLVSGLLMTAAGVAAGRHLHFVTIGHLLRAPYQWFEETPSGRIISRFSSDISQVDTSLAFHSDNFVQMVLTACVLVITISIVVPMLIPLVLLFAAVYCFQVMAVDKTNREVKRFANVAISPVISNVKELLQGQQVIRSMKLQELFWAKHLRYVMHYAERQYAASTIIQCDLFATQGMASLLAVGCSVIIVSSQGTGMAIETDEAAMALAYAFLVPFFLGAVTQLMAMMQQAFTALEHILEYASDEVPQEAPWEREADLQLTPPASQVTSDDVGVTMNTPAGAVWPWRGEIEWKCASLRYKPHLPPTIKELDLKIEAGHKVGVVGRTGAGKTSLIVMLFRLVEMDAGLVLIDGVDTSTLGLHTLRAGMAMIPQMPILFEGSLLHNIDPFGQYGRQDVQGALEKVGLGFDLEMNIESGGANLSVGERQLVSFTRAMLRQARIVVMDEPTSNVDFQTDSRIQELTREAFKGCTLLTVAHRLNTVIDYDRILVLDRGVRVEYAAPFELLQREDGHLAAMAKVLGPEAFNELVQRASDLSPEPMSPAVHETKLPQPEEVGFVNPPLSMFV